MARKIFSILMVGLFFSVSGCKSSSNSFLESKKIDLTYPFSKETIFWPTEEGFVLETEFQGMTEKGYYYEANRFRSAEHGGTHMDAPIHFAKGKHTIAQIPLEQLMGNGVVIDVSQKTLQDPDEQITVEDLLAWEKSHGQIPPKSIVLLKTGYGRYWPDREKYLGTTERGQQAVAKLHFPGLHPGAARWLIQNRNIKMVGIDTASIDYGQSQDFPSHQILGEHQILILENVANLDQLPADGFTIIASPMKIESGSGAPTRVIAILGGKS